MPLFSFLFYYINREYISIYVDGVYQIDNENIDWLVDNWLHTKNIEFRWIDINQVDGKLISICQKALKQKNIIVEGDCLSIARALVMWIDKLPNWTKINKNLSRNAKQLCNVVKKATDPNKLLLDDLPSILNIRGDKGIDCHSKEMIKLFDELESNYVNLLKEVKTQILEALNAKSWKDLQTRFEPLLEKTGNLEIKALIQKILDAENDGVIERILEQVAGVLNTDFTETSIKEARLNLSALLNRLRQIENNASAGRDTNLVSIAMTGVSNKKDIVNIEEYVTKEDNKTIKKVAKDIENLLNAGNLSKGVKISAILKAIESIDKKNK